MHLGKLLRAAALRHPQKTALICRDESISYEDLDRAVRGLARWFLRHGLRPGDRVAIHSANSVDAVKLLLACFHAGLIAVPVNLRLKTAEMAYILAHSAPAMCFSQPELAPVAAAAAAECPPGIALHIRLPEVTDVDAAGELPEFDGDRVALILYTSGTTARPKGVLHSHASLLGSARTVWPTGVGENTILMVTVPLMHASGLSCSTLPALLTGATTVLTPVFDACEVLDAIERHRCTWGLGLPAMMQFLTVEQERHPRNVSSLRDWVAGGDAVPVNLQERFQRYFSVPLREGYAMSESVIIACNRADAPRPGSLGRPCEGVEVRVVDFSENLLPHGQIGELEVRSPGNFVGYWHDEPATAAAMRDGWIRTGDLAWRDLDGYLWFSGRRKEVIIRGGSNISPQEVEEALYQHPAVMEVGVIGMPDPIYSEQVVACVSLREGHTVHPEELIDFARARLADYKLPSRIVFLPALPKGITGKVQRRALKEMAAGVG